MSKEAEALLAVITARTEPYGEDPEMATEDIIKRLAERGYQIVFDPQIVEAEGRIMDGISSALQGMGYQRA